MASQSEPEAGPQTSGRAGALDDPREELASIAASLRAYLEWQVDTGAGGIPRKPRAPAAPRAEAPRAEAPREEAPRADAPRVDAGTRADAARADPVRPEAPREEAPRADAPRVDAGTRADAARADAAREFDERVTTPLEVNFTAPAPAAAAAKVAVPVVEARALDVVRQEVASCTKCALATTRTNTVFARGNPEAKLCFVGEAPGADEDEQGVPFVGKAGQLLDKMIVAMGLDPEKDVYVCNIIKCRPPGNRRPEPDEVDACIPYLHEQLAKIDPKAIVALGNTAVAALLGTKQGITKIRGVWKLYKGRPVMPTYHPSYLLRPGPTQAESKRQVWEDLQVVMKELGLEKKPKA